MSINGSSKAVSAEETGLISSAPVVTKKNVASWVHLLAGASGGLATAIVTSPLDVLRTRLQSDFYRTPSKGPDALQSTRPSQLAQSGHASNHKTMRIVSSIYRAEGWRAFFRGLGPSMAGVVPAAAIKFYVYGNCKNIAANIMGHAEDSPLVHAQAAICAGLASSTATNPIWLVKTRLQLDKASTAGDPSTRRYRNSIDCVRQVLRTEGVAGFYRGMSASYLGSIETALHLVLYERLKVGLRRWLEPTEGKGTPLWDEFSHWVSTSGAASSAKLAAGLTTYPHEVARTRLRQAPLEHGKPKYTGLVQCFRTIAKEEGMAGLYGGLAPHMLRSLPSAVITLGVYEFVLRFANT
ncbi:Mitochondrial carrier protein [Penicillium bovifimosum]|uniref:Mitochondrial carrier protein n=1 Tax=Penicillium bovifimosum TaxID=126998 RepID=A0A9W9H5G9_9EURO|nr:Mitochondrial carrier protein [Penicillium bovifimosum]KAJ5139037.1 Mitochondrial carrier protein [Penicillium bovifimosum]